MPNQNTSLRVSYVLLAFNQEQFIEEAVKSALAQTYSPLEVILSDDCSSDNTFKIISTLAANYSGPHTLVVRQSSRNCGISEHLNQIMKVCHGELVLVAAGDDISSPTRTSVTVECYLARDKKVSSIYSNAVVIDSTGEQIGLHYQLSSPPMDLGRGDAIRLKGVPWVLGATHAFSSELYTQFGSINASVISEDKVLAVRALLMRGIEYIEMPLVYYRINCGGLVSGKALWNSQESLKRFYINRVASLRQIIHDIGSARDSMSITREEFLYYIIVARFLLLIEELLWKSNYSTSKIGRVMWGLLRKIFSLFRRCLIPADEYVVRFVRSKRTAAVTDSVVGTTTS